MVLLSYIYNWEEDMNTNILITGSYCSLNNGDLAMVKGFVESLVKRHKIGRAHV